MKLIIELKPTVKEKVAELIDSVNSKTLGYKNFLIILSEAHDKDILSVDLKSETRDVEPIIEKLTSENYEMDQRIKTLEEKDDPRN